MANKVRYGVISDIHRDPRMVPLAINVLRSLGAHKLLINGDIGNRQETIKESQDRIAFVLDSVGKSGLESYVQPGSHESMLAYEPVVSYFSEKYSNIIDATKNQKVEQSGHHLVFLSGSDFLCGGEYQIGNNAQIPSGRYMYTEKGLAPFSELEQYVGAIQKGIAYGAMQYSNMQDLKKLVTAPEKTVVVCHVPRKFNGLETCVDMAEFGEVTEDFVLQRERVEKGSVYPIHIASLLAKGGYPVQIKRENRGNEDLKNLYGELGIRKAVSGHFHESSHRANDRNGNSVGEGKFVDDLFWNSGFLDLGYTGILTVDGEKASYQNVRIR